MAMQPTLWKNIGTVNTNDSGPGGNTQNDSQVVGLAGGGFVVVWTDNSHTGTVTSNDSVKFQIYDFLGNKVGGEQEALGAMLNGGFDEFDPAVTALPDGGFAISLILTLTSGTPGGPVFAHYDAAGNLQTIESTGDDASSPSIAALPDGSTISVFEFVDGGGDVGIAGVPFSASGTLGTPFPVLDETDDQFDPDVATLSNGNVVVVYEDESSGGPDVDIAFGIFSPTGSEVVGRTSLAINFTIERDPAVAALVGGGFVAIWEDVDGFTGDASGSALVAEIRGNDGTLITSDFLVNTSATGDQGSVDVTALSDGGFVATWFDNGSRLAGQVFDALGNKVGDEFVVSGTGPFDFQPSVSALKDGRFVITYTSDVELGSNREIVAQVFDPRQDPITGTEQADAIAARLDGGIINALGGNDTIQGFNGIDFMRGGNGNDTERGGNGNDRLFGDNGLDTLFGDNGIDRLFGGNHNDIMRGGNQTDFLRGENGNDRMFGDAGDDVLTGGLGRDIQNGGAGRDRFDYDNINESRGAARDRIVGWEDFKDRIDLRTIDADTTLGGNQRFKFIGDDAFSRTAGELHIKSVGSIVRVEGDVNGDGRADFQIDVQGTSTLVQSEFLL
ncbi:MAG: M10 family metallopeptidase C-terminal domain-containing protein [Alphaproteobacteria bacterium]|nr:M10 family metallopeptidase C-terminal domain-containing protein [Alphaproteobacteria bacterium]